MAKLLDAGLRGADRARLPRGPRRRHRPGGRSCRTAPSTSTSPTRRTCSARSPASAPRRWTALADVARSGHARRGRRGRAARVARAVPRDLPPLRRGHPGVDGGPGRRPRARAARAGRVPADHREPAATAWTRPTPAHLPDPALAAAAMLAMVERLAYFTSSRDLGCRRRRRRRHARRRCCIAGSSVRSGVARLLDAEQQRRSGAEPTAGAVDAGDLARPGTWRSPHSPRSCFTASTMRNMPAHARVARRQPAAVGVRRQRAADAQLAVLDERAALALAAEAERLRASAAPST